ncbi:hypothetical protein ES703_115483 [subsurface metagenome]
MLQLPQVLHYFVLVIIYNHIDLFHANRPHGLQNMMNDWLVIDREEAFGQNLAQIAHPCRLSCRWDDPEPDPVHA